MNDTQGHGVGDTLLKEVAGRMLGCVGPLDTVARLGGDEFGVLVLASSKKGAAEIADALLATMSAPFIHSLLTEPESDGASHINGS